MASQTKETLRKLIPGTKAKDNAATHPSTTYEVGLGNLFSISGKEAKESKDPNGPKESKESKEVRKKAEKEEDKLIREITQRLKDLQWKNIAEPQVRYALRHRSVAGNPVNAVFLLEVFRETMEGIVYPPNTRTHLLGAENRHAVTCYLDATLFAMFARSRSYEYILFRQYPDQRRQRLSNMLRLWVNMLRRGYLIQTDITEQLQEAVAESGWPDARTLRQQDASEAFSFIADSLDLPPTTVKTDLFHVGKELQDDHKFVQERLFTVSIPQVQGDAVVRIEDLLVGHFFNNKIQVKRPLQRRSTMRSIRSIGEKNQIVHIEVVEGASQPSTPSLPPSKSLEDLRQNQTNGLFSLRKPHQQTQEKRAHDDLLVNFRRRASTLRKEDNTNAWQHSTVIPHFTESGPSGAVEMAAYYARRRPTVGICLKRYAMDSNGHAIRLSTKVNVSLEILHPEFIADDEVNGHPVEFKLVLNSVVCHRAISATNSIESGHYVSLVRGEVPVAQAAVHAPPAAPVLPRVTVAPVAPAEPASNVETLPTGTVSENAPSKWMLFDDLASSERVSNVDILDRLERETPYLLFYEIVPINEDHRGDPPSYDEVQNMWPTDIKADITSDNSNDPIPSPDETTVKSLELAAPNSLSTSPRMVPADATTVPRVSVEFSREVSRTTSATDEKSMERRGRQSTSSIRRSDLQLSEGNFGNSGGSLGLISSGPTGTLSNTSGALSTATSLRGTSAPTTPGEEFESKSGLFGLGRRRSRREPGGNGKKSRPTSQVVDISRWFDNLVKKHSTEEINGITASSAPMSIPEDSELARKLTLLNEEEPETPDRRSSGASHRNLDGEASHALTTDFAGSVGLASGEKENGFSSRKSSVFGSFKRAVKGKKEKEKEKEKSRERSKSRNRLQLAFD